MRLRRPRAIRVRLTLWTTAALGALFVALGAAAVVLLDRALRANVDASMSTVAHALAASSRDHAPAGMDEMLEDFLGPSFADRFFRQLDPAGRPDPRVESPGGRNLPFGREARMNAARGRETWETIVLPGPVAAPTRLLTLPVVENGRLVNVVQVASSLGEVETARRQFLWILAALAPLGIAGVAAGAWMLVGRALAPVDRMVETARQIGAEGLARRIEGESADDEIGRLAAVLNGMLARLEASFEAVRSFSADAAHELRTPLTILKGEIEVALASAKHADDWRGALESCQEEVERLVSLVEDLLFLARSDADAVERPLGRVDLAELLDEASPALGALAERGGARLDVRRPPSLAVAGSEPMLFRVLLNLVDNAVRHAGAGRRVDVVLEQRDGRAVLEVRDDGPGIALRDQKRIFDRFYRADPARPRGGAGLGLAIVRSIVALHGGAIALDSAPGKGAVFRVSLPVV